MEGKVRDEITRIAKDFVSGFEGTFDSINGTGWLIVDPLSGFLSAAGFGHEVSQLPANKQHCQVLILEFPDGDKFIPAGADLKPLDKAFENYMWL